MIAMVTVDAEGRTVIPPEVRAALHVNEGDLLAWEITADGAARVRPVHGLDADYLEAVQSTLEEWASPEDEEAYRDL